MSKAPSTPETGGIEILGGFPAQLAAALETLSLLVERSGLQMSSLSGPAASATDVNMARDANGLFTDRKGVSAKGDDGMTRDDNGLFVDRKGPSGAGDGMKRDENGLFVDRKGGATGGGEVKKDTKSLYTHRL